MKEVEVSAAIIIKDNKIFITQRGYGEFKDLWEFPGGKLESGETKEECIIREIKEELDANIIVLSFLSTIKYQYQTFNLTMHNFICALKDDHMILKEHEAAKWLTKETLYSVEWLPADLGLIETIEKIMAK